MTQTRNTVQHVPLPSKGNTDALVGGFKARASLLGGGPVQAI